MSKILYFVSSLNFGGAEKQTVLDANLMSKDHTVHLVSFSKGPLNQVLSNKVHFLKLGRSGYLKNAKEIAAYCNKEKIDIIHSALFAASIISGLASLFCRVRVIWHFHSHEYDMPLKSRLAVSLASQIPDVKKIAFVNKELIEYFRSFHLPKRKFVLLYNHSTVVRDSIVKDNKEKVRIGYLGRVIALKRVNYLIDLAIAFQSKGINDFEIHIVGSGDQFESIAMEVSDNQLEPYFKLHGFQIKVNDFYKTFDFFVNPSEEECLSVAMIDAGMHGLPIVGFDVGGNSEIIKHQESGFIVCSLTEFIEACAELVSNNQKRRTFGMESYKHCNQYFSESVHHMELEKIYKEVLK